MSYAVKNWHPFTFENQEEAARLLGIARCHISKLGEHFVSFGTDRRFLPINELVQRYFHLIVGENIKCIGTPTQRLIHYKLSFKIQRLCINLEQLAAEQTFSRVEKLKSIIFLRWKKVVEDRFQTGAILMSKSSPIFPTDAIFSNLMIKNLLFAFTKKEINEYFAGSERPRSRKSSEWFSRENTCVVSLESVEKIALLPSFITADNEEEYTPVRQVQTSRSWELDLAQPLLENVL